MPTLRHAAAAAALCLLTAWAAAPAAAAKADSEPAQAATKKKPKHKDPKAPKGGNVKFQKGPSEETAAERDRRLTRECKGRPNAGACLGYAR